MASKLGLDTMNGFLLKVLGPLVHQVRRDQDGGIWYQFCQNPDEQLKSSMRQYLKDYNKEHGTRLSVAFPKKFRLRLRERAAPRGKKGTARPKAKGRGRRQARRQ